MKLAHIADPHLGIRQYHRQTPTGINQREADVAQAFRTTIDGVIAAQPDVVVFGGDLFHSVRPTNSAIVFAFRQLQRLREALPGAPLVLIADDYTDVALEAYRRGALVCVRAHLDQQLPAAVEQALAEISGQNVNMTDRVTSPGLSLYVTSKGAVQAMTRALARELGPLGITINSVDPGSTDTDMNPANGPFAAGQLAHNALGRFGTPEDVAATVLHLAGPGGRSITGTSILVDSGFNA